MAEGQDTMFYSRSHLLIALSTCPHAHVCFWMRRDANILPHLGLDSIKRSMETTQHCCLATATIPLVFCCYGTAVQISL